VKPSTENTNALSNDGVREGICSFEQLAPKGATRALGMTDSFRRRKLLGQSRLTSQFPSHNSILIQRFGQMVTNHWGKRHLRCNCQVVAVIEEIKSAYDTLRLSVATFPARNKVGNFARASTRVPSGYEADCAKLDNGLPHLDAGRFSIGEENGRLEIKALSLQRHNQVGSIRLRIF
jgi:hypothetical protein